MCWIILLVTDCCRMVVFCSTSETLVNAKWRELKAKKGEFYELQKWSGDRYLEQDRKVYDESVSIHIVVLRYLTPNIGHRSIIVLEFPTQEELYEHMRLYYPKAPLEAKEKVSLNGVHTYLYYYTLP